MENPGDIAGRRPDQRSVWLASFLLIALGAGVFAGTLGHRFPLDDAVHVERNLQIRSMDRAIEAFSGSTWPGNLYRPLVTLSYAATYGGFGLDPAAYHATNVLLHVVVVLLLANLLAHLFRAELALATSALFAVHPVHVEVVASIANRTELLAAAFAFATLLLVLPRARTGPLASGAYRLRIALAGVCFLLALLAKESALVVLLLAPLAWWAYEGRDRERDGDVEPLGARGAARAGAAPAWRRALVGRMPALAVLGAAVGAYLALRVRALGGLVPPGAEISVFDNPLVAVGVPERVLRGLILLGRYLTTILLPWNLSADYSLGTTGLGEDPVSLASLGALAVLAVFVALTCWAIARRDREIAFFGLWFFACFAVTANIAFPIGTIFAERLAYLPSVGICGLLGCALDRLVRVPRPRLLATGALVACLAVLTLRYVPVWYDSTSLFAYEFATSPGSVKVLHGYAEALSRAGAIGDARQTFARVLEDEPRYTDAAYGLAVLDLKEGHRDSAVGWLERALEIDPRHVPSLVMLGRMRLREDESDEAGRLFVRALNADNESFDARLGLLATCLERGNLTQALELRADLARLDPDNRELIGLGRELDRQLHGKWATTPLDAG